MARFIQKAAAARNIPLLALALFAAVFMGSKVYASVIGIQTDQWVYNADCGSPANPSCYEPHSGELESDCEESQNEVCGINAPLDQSQTVPTPLIEGQLETDLNSGLFIGKPNIFTMPRTN